MLYEAETFVHYLKDALADLVDLRKEKFERIYLETDLTALFERLLAWFEERSQSVSNSTESLRLIYYVRRALFKLVDREPEYAFYLMKLARLFRKSSSDVLEVNKLYKECE